MKIDRLLGLNKDEKPLEYITPDGGYTSIFNTIGCIGDSLSSGEFEAKHKDGTTTYHDFYEYSWGQFIARDSGVKVYNFSRGGMSAKEYMTTFGKEIDAFNIEKKCKAYIIALGANDLFSDFAKIDIGSIDDDENANTFSRYYQDIIRKYKEIEPNAKFFLVTFPNEQKEGKELELVLAHRDLIYKIAKKYENSYVIDLYQYAPIYNNELRSKFCLHGHLNPMGYKLTAKFIESYIDYIVRSDFSKFKQVGFIGTEYYDKELDK